MEQTNYQELNKKMFSDHIHDPSAVGAEHSRALEDLTVRYPYSQLLRSFYTRSLAEADAPLFEKELSRTALYWPDRGILRAVIEDPERLKHVPADPPTVSDTISEAIPVSAEPPRMPGDIDQAAPQAEDLSFEERSDSVVEEPQADEETQVVEAAYEEVEQNSIAEEIEVTFGDTAADVSSPQAKEDSIEQVLTGENAAEEASIAAEEDELDLHLKRYAAAGDYLPAEEADLPESIFKPEIEPLASSSPETEQKEQQKVSKYDDDKLPYSFLWWLSRTRKEHTENYQPYISFHLDTSQSIKRNTVDQLSTQIIENIFHLQSPVDELKDAPRTVPFQVKRKEDYILEKFIREEPQIKAPNSDKLDNENKARKSAEDPNDLVSETLAHIYTDQMLFHKAIDTYKKLSLKFPEKSTYFADQILELEKKIN